MRSPSSLPARLALVALSLVIFAGAEVSAAPTGSLSASPNPPTFAPGSTLGTTTLSWSTTGTQTASLWVYVGSAPGKLVARDRSGSSQIAWIRRGVPYTFRLFAAAGEQGAPLASVHLGPARGQLEASANPVLIQPGATLGSMTLKWASAGAPQASVWVFTASNPGGTLFSGSVGGQALVRWIQPRRTYTFKLFAGPTAAAPLLDTLEVRGVRLAPAGVGLNKFDLFTQYLGHASGGGGAAHRTVTLAMAKKAIRDAGALGAPYLRVAVTGYSPSGFRNPGTLGLWQQNPQGWWAAMDDMFADLDRAKVRLVPSFMWNAYQFPAASGETLSDLIARPASASRRLLYRYLQEFITRYRGRATVAFYELTNELNLLVDLDNVRRYQAKWGSVGPSGNFTTDQMNAFTRDFAAKIRSLDPSRGITSGFSMPRPSAEHLRRRPEFSPGGPDWGKDSRDEFLANLTSIHRDVGIVSVHFYNGNGSNERFGVRGRTNADLLDVVKRGCDAMGKALFVGEFGDRDPHVKQDPSGPFASKVLAKISQLGIAYGAPWVWEFYQHSTHATYTTQHDAFNLEPGYTDVLIGRLQDANRRMGVTLPVRPAVDRTPPEVVLTWPLGGAALSGRVEAYAVASDDGRAAQRVEFLVDGNAFATVTAPPYRFMLDTTTLAPGSHVLTARAYDAAGNRKDSSATVSVR
jgi:hypothetical protein